MAARMFQGGSGGRSPESFWKKTNHGNLMPACRNTPAEAAMRRNQVTASASSVAACAIIDLLTKPEVRGKDEMDSAPIVPQRVVKGIVRNSPPRSVHFRRPVMYSTEPADMRSSAL